MIVKTVRIQWHIKSAHKVFLQFFNTFLFKINNLYRTTREFIHCLNKMIEDSLVIIFLLFPR